MSCREGRKPGVPARTKVTTCGISPGCCTLQTWMALPRTPLVLVLQRGADATDSWATLVGRELVASRMQSNWHSSARTLFGGWKAFPCLICPVPWKEEGCLLGAKLLFFCAATCSAHRAGTAGMGLACNLQRCFLKQTKKTTTTAVACIYLVLWVAVPAL